MTKETIFTSPSVDHLTTPGRNQLETEQMDKCTHIAAALGIVASMLIGFGTFNLGWRDKLTRFLRDKRFSDIQIDRIAWWLWLACYLISIAGLALGALWWIGVVSYAVGNDGLMITISSHILRESIYCQPKHNASAPPFMQKRG